MKVSLIILATIFSLWILGGLIIFLAASVRTKRADSHMKHNGDARTRSLKGVDWFFGLHPTVLQLTAHDGVVLRGYYLENPAGRGIAALFHGWRSNFASDFGMSLEHYYELGFSLFVPSQRACGISGGHFICFGQKEKLDCAQWCRYLSDVHPDENIVLIGVSMGAVTVLGATGENLPASVKCIVADCGFTSPRAEFSALARQRIHIGIGAFLPTANIFAHLLAHFSLYGTDTQDILKRNTLPILFIHGEADRFVPISFTYLNYAATSGNKEIVTFPHAAHAMSFASDSEKYMASTSAFFQKYV